MMSEPLSYFDGQVYTNENIVLVSWSLSSLSMLL